jgi:hypothetical protein
MYREAGVVVPKDIDYEKIWTTDKELNFLDDIIEKAPRDRKKKRLVKYIKALCQRRFDDNVNKTTVQEAAYRKLKELSC